MPSVRNCRERYALAPSWIAVRSPSSSRCPRAPRAPRGPGSTRTPAPRARCRGSPRATYSRTTRRRPGSARLPQPGRRARGPPCRVGSLKGRCAVTAERAGSIRKRASSSDLDGVSGGVSDAGLSFLDPLGSPPACGPGSSTTAPHRRTPATTDAASKEILTCASRGLSGPKATSRDEERDREAGAGRGRHPEEMGRSHAGREIGEPEPGGHDGTPPDAQDLAADPRDQDGPRDRAPRGRGERGCRRARPRRLGSANKGRIHEAAPRQQDVFDPGEGRDGVARESSARRSHSCASASGGEGSSSVRSAVRCASALLTACWPLERLHWRASPMHHAPCESRMETRAMHHVPER